jgi:hypothetical protein
MTDMTKAVRARSLQCRFEAGSQEQITPWARDGKGKVETPKELDKHTGTSFDDFLDEEGYRDEVEGGRGQAVACMGVSTRDAAPAEDQADDGPGTKNQPVPVGSHARSSQ